MRSYAAAPGASFLPNRPFTPGELVRVHARWRAGRAVRTISTSFTIASPVAPPTISFPATPGTAADIQSFLSQPALHPPVVRVHQAAAAGAPGYLFASPFLGPGQWGPMIFDSAGNLLWFRSLPAGQDAADFRTQTFHGRDVLTWWQGRTVSPGYGLGEDVIADSHYRTVAVVRAGNGMPTDEHEFTVLPNGVALVLAYVPVRADLASVGGPPGGVAFDCALQEVDIHTGLVMWEWRSLGHVALSDAFSKAPASSVGYFDYFHINSAQLLADGNFLISARNTSAVYELAARSGRILWRLGGKASSFSLGSGVQFAYQHDAEMRPNGEISVFDDEGFPPVKPPSRAELIRLDLKNRTATLVQQLVRGSGPLLTNSQGNMQELPGGGWMVGWGGLPNLTEFNAGGQMLFDAQLPTGESSYRVYREPWSGQPVEPPMIAADSSAGGTSVFASWNGATGVTAWQLLSGSSAAHLSPVSITPRSGFETTIPAPAAAFLQVRALGSSGRVLGTSRAVRSSGR
jgi:hypothetical protein